MWLATSIDIWFVCKFCRCSFKTIDSFIDHKREKHFTEYQNIKCIFFEEGTPDRNFGIEVPIANTVVEACYSDPGKRDLDLDQDQRSNTLSNDNDSKNSQDLYEENPDLYTGVENSPNSHSASEISSVVAKRRKGRSSSKTMNTTPANSNRDPKSNFPPTQVTPDVASVMPLSLHSVHSIHSGSADLDHLLDAYMDNCNTRKGDPHSHFTGHGHGHSHGLENGNNFVLAHGHPHQLHHPHETLLRIPSTHTHTIPLDMGLHLGCNVPSATNQSQDSSSIGGMDAKVKANCSSQYKHNPYAKIRQQIMNEIEAEAIANNNARFRQDGFPNLGSSIESSSNPDLVNGIGTNNNSKPPAKRRWRPKKSKDTRFVFPKPDPDADCYEDPVTLRDWLLKKNARRGSAGRNNNIILLDPDPVMQFRLPSKNDPVTCKLCCEPLISAAEIKIHVTHCWLQNKGRHRYCIPCEKTFSRPDRLKVHALIFHGTEEQKASRPKYKCNQCSKDFFHKSDLQYHLDAHKSKEEQSRPFVCHICERSFRRPYFLKVHLSSHSNERPFKCSHPNCTKTFKTKQCLYLHTTQVHLKLPGGGKNPTENRNLTCVYRCPQPNCGKIFSLRSRLKRHSKVHSKDRPFQCSFLGCTSAFKQKDNLVKHEQEHTGEVVFECEDCGKNYLKRWSYRSHMLVSHGKKV